MSHAIVSLDGEHGILKSSDARPSWTLTSFLTYVGIFGYSGFLDEHKRIKTFGACEGFYYVHEVVGDEREIFFIDMLSSKQLGYKCYPNRYTKIHDFDYGFHVTQNEIKVYRGDSFEYSITYDEKKLRGDIVTGIFLGDIRKLLREKYNILDNAND